MAASLFYRRHVTGLRRFDRNIVSALADMTSVPLPAGVHSIAFAHFGEKLEHLLHLDMGFVAHADHEQIVDNLIILECALCANRRWRLHLHVTHRMKAFVPFGVEAHPVSLED